MMGILNVTPDSFSDGGRHVSAAAAVEHGLQMTTAGADIIDVGGESTRPGAGRIDAAEEMRRVLPVIRGLARLGVTVSVDTMRAAVAEAAIGAGAALINDVSGGLADSEMARVAAESDVPWVLTHWRGHSDQMQAAAVYGDVVSEVRHELLIRVDRAVTSGVRPDRIVLDPGFGFAKKLRHDLALLAGIDAIVDTGFPVLVGTSRKRFLGAALVDRDSEARPTSGRDAATLTTTALVAKAGAWAVRVHDVAPNADAVRLVAAAHPTARCTHRSEALWDKVQNRFEGPPASVRISRVNYR